MGEPGYLGLRFPEAYGGEDWAYKAAIVRTEEIGRIAGGTDEIQGEIIAKELKI